MRQHLSMLERSALWECPAYRAAHIAMRAKTAAENKRKREQRRAQHRRACRFSGGRLPVAHA